MKHPIITRSNSAALAAAIGIALVPQLATAQATAKDAATADKIARGKYLVTTSGCHDCHTPFKMGENGPEWDMGRMLSGHPENLQMTPPPKLPEGPWLITSSATNTAHAGPWGVSFTANLTPDPETGLGKWSFRNFKDTIRTGRHMGRGRTVLPPMPIPVYKNFTDADLEAVYSYLQSIPPIRNRVPEPWAPADAVKTAQAK
jgi:Cytochrome c